MSENGHSNVYKLARELRRRGRLTALDEKVFDLLSVQIELFEKAAARVIETGGFLVDDEGDLYLDPHLEIALESGELVKELMAEFLILPASD